jgi:hypothetical protein
MGSMKRLALLFSCSAAMLCGADLANVHTVYLLKMAKGLDQFLANRLTTGHVFQIVTDPKLADAIFTDQIGEGFQMKLEEFFPPPEEEKPEPPPKAKDEKAKGEKAGDEANPMLGDTVNKLSNPSMSSSFGRSKGTVFLVDAKSRQVVWSAYQPPKGVTPKAMDRTANDIVSRIKHDLNPKGK